MNLAKNSLATSSNGQQLPLEGFVRIKQVLEAFPVSRSTWLAGVKDGRYPKPVKLSERTTAWRVSDIRKLIEESSKVAE